MKKQHQNITNSQRLGDRKRLKLTEHNYKIVFEYDADDTMFAGYIYELNAREFTMVTRSLMARELHINKAWLKLLLKIVISLQTVIV